MSLCLKNRLKCSISIVIYPQEKRLDIFRSSEFYYWSSELNIARCKPTGDRFMPLSWLSCIFRTENKEILTIIKVISLKKKKVLRLTNILTFLGNMNIYSIIVYLCGWICVYICMWAHVIMCVHLCVCRSEVNVEYLPQSLFSLFLERVFHWILSLLIG